MNIILPPEPVSADAHLAQLFKRRATRRQWGTTLLDEAALGACLYAAAGASGGKRTTPSAENMRPLRLHILIRHVTNVAAGVYLYCPYAHELQWQRTLPDTLQPCALGVQPWVDDASLVICISADVDMMNAHFAHQGDSRGARFTYMEAGAVMQNLYLQVAELSLGAVWVAGINEQQLSHCLALPQAHTALGLMCISALE